MSYGASFLYLCYIPFPQFFLHLFLLLALRRVVEWKKIGKKREDSKEKERLERQDIPFLPFSLAISLGIEGDVVSCLWYALEKSFSFHFLLFPKHIHDNEDSTLKRFPRK